MQWLVQPGETVAAGDVLLILEAMKMEHEVHAPQAGRLQFHFYAAGEAVAQGDLLSNLELLRHIPPAEKAQKAHDFPLQSGADVAPCAPAENADAPRADLNRVLQRHAHTLDASRPEAMAKRHAQGLRSARENVADLCDADSFVEYGALAVAAQSRRRSADDLVQNTPADGMVTGIGCVNGQRTVVMAYDATVLAGTQGLRNHQKTDRMLGSPCRTNCLWCCSPKAAAGALATWTCPSWPGCMWPPSPVLPASTARCPWWASWRGVVLLATPHSWAAAM